jgi:hypothetical protein
VVVIVTVWLILLKIRRYLFINGGETDELVSNQALLDLTTSSFSTIYFNNLVSKRAVLRSDHALFNCGETDSLFQNTLIKLFICLMVVKLLSLFNGAI